MTRGPLNLGRYFWLSALMILAGAALRYPAFGHDFAADDYAQLAMMEGVYPSPRGPLSLFTFSSGEPEDVQRLMDSGFYPWFSHPRLRLSMMRPLGSALMWVDHGLFGRWALGYHLHSLLWWLALLGVSAWVFYRLLGPRLGLLSTFLFVLDETHGVMMGWIANRNAMVAALLCLLALERYVRAREQARPMPSSVWLLYATALCAGEYALCMLGYFLAFEWLEQRDPFKARVRAFAPLLGLAVAFLALRALLGFGSYGSDLYIDPLRSPLAFLDAASERLPVLLSDLLLTLRSDWWTFGVPPVFQSARFGWVGKDWASRLESWRSLQVLLGWAGLAFAALLVWGARTSPSPTGAAAAGDGRTDRRVRLTWLALGALLSVIPPLVTAPSTRSLVGPAWGLSAVLAILLASVPALVRVSLPAPQRAWGYLRGAAIVAFVALHIFVGPVLGFWETVQMAQIANVVRHTALGAAIDEDNLEGKRVIFLSSAEPITPIYFSLVRRLHDRPAPRSTWLLCPASSVFDLSRPTPSSLEVYLPAQTMLDGGFERIFRTERAPVGVGHRFQVDGMVATVLALRGGKPSRMRYQFETTLDDPRYVVLAATVFGLRPATLPAVGETLRVGPPSLPTRVPTD